MLTGRNTLAILLAATFAAACGGSPAPTTAPAAPRGASVAGEHTVSVPAAGSENAPWDAAVSVEGGLATVEWRGRNTGDFDLNGAVSIADLTPLAQHFGETVLYEGGVPVVDGDNEYLAAIDGDGNGTISIADITPLAQHFNQELAGYRVYAGYRPTGAAETVWSEPFRRPPGEPEADYSVAFNDSRAEGEVQRYSFSFPLPLDFSGQFAVRIVATDGVDEGALLETGLYDYEAGDRLTLPPDGEEQLAATGLAPSIDAFATTGADWEAGAPVVVYRDPGGGLIYAYYNGREWVQHDTGLGTDYSLHALRIVEGVPYLAAYGIGGIDILRGSLEGTQWEPVETVATIAPGMLALDCLSGSAGPTQLVIGYVSGAEAEAAFNCATYNLDSGGLTVDEGVYAPGDSILSMRMAARSGDETLEVVICHGTLDPEAMEIDTALRHLRRSAAGEWTGSDLAIDQHPEDGARNPIAADLSLTGTDLTSIVAYAARKRVIFTLEVPMLDAMGMGPVAPGGTPHWTEFHSGTTGIQFPDQLVLSWAAFPAAARGLDNAFVFNQISGSFTITYPPLQITGGEVAPSWRETLFKYGGGWSDEPLAPTGGILQDAVADGAGGWQMVYVESGTVDIGALLGGGEPPSGAIVYFRNEEPEV